MFPAPDALQDIFSVRDKELLPAEVSVGIVAGYGKIGVQTVFRKKREIRFPENSAAHPAVVAQNGQYIAGRLEKLVPEGVDPFRRPEVLRVGPNGEFSEKFPVEPDPGFVVDRAEIQRHIRIGREVRRIKGRPVPEVPAGINVPELKIKHAGNFDRSPGAVGPEIRTEGPSAGLREDRNQPSLSQCQALNGMGQEEADEGWFLFETGKGEPR